jgi:NADPH:quinone reductase-like Zn-dependent oxidoreductase
MRAMQICSAGLTDFRLSEQPIPRPGKHEILVRIRAASLNYRDLVVLKGIYKPNITFPFVPLSDACGEVIEVGSEVKRFKIGDRVVPTFIQGWPSGWRSRPSSHSIV